MAAVSETTEAITNVRRYAAARPRRAAARAELRAPRLALGFLAAAAPLAGLGLVLFRPELDLHWQHQPAHFWLVLGIGALSATLAYATGEAARRRNDARVLLVSLVFLAAAGFLGLHALATPGVLLDSPNAGFFVATPVGLLVGAAFAAASATALTHRDSGAALRWARRARAALLLVMAVWAALSLTSFLSLGDPLSAEPADAPIIAIAGVGVVLYAFAAAAYVRLYRERRTPLLLGVAAAFVLLAEAMVAVAAARNWHVSWWEWHLLMLSAFALVAAGARLEWREERFRALYLPETASATREVSVLFADLAGFTAASERLDSAEIQAMLDEYHRAVLPVILAHRGEIDKLVGDAIMVRFNATAEQPDHALRAAETALAFQAAAAKVAREHPSWPRFRVGVNSGEATVGLVGGHGKTELAVIGDAVNVAARLEGQAEPGEVVIGEETHLRLPAGVVAEPLGSLAVKGRREPVVAYVLRALREPESAVATPSPTKTHPET